MLDPKQIKNDIVNAPEYTPAFFRSDFIIPAHHHRYVEYKRNNFSQFPGSEIEDGILYALEELGLVEKELHFPQMDLTAVQGPIATIITPRTPKPAPVPSKEDFQSRAVPAARTMVVASTASTAHAKKTDMNNANPLI